MASLARRERMCFATAKQRMWEEIKRLSQLLSDALAQRANRPRAVFQRLI